MHVVTRDFREQKCSAAANSDLFGGIRVTRHEVVMVDLRCQVSTCLALESLRRQLCPSR